MTRLVLMPLLAAAWFAGFVASGRAEFFLTGGPSFSRVELLRGSGDMDGIVGSAGYAWKYAGVEAGYADLGDVTTDFYGEPIGYLATITPDQRIEFSARSGYGLLFGRTPAWRGISLEFAAGAARVSTRATAKAVITRTGQPIFDERFTRTRPLYRASLRYSFRRSFALAVRASWLRTTGISDPDRQFGGPRSKFFTVEPTIEYRF